ncbi:MAG: NAD-dependent deacetylase [Candidatus Tokpelaia sp. JSC189]|nr:MAG: NAD-dependent deacetylase [Candidatus Tokpelaia sp. JSC189]
MEKNPSIILLTGAGISAESGLATFRDSSGTWEKQRIEDVATPQAFRKNPALVLEFYNRRRRDAAVAQPNAAHEALVQLEKGWPGDFFSLHRILMLCMKQQVRRKYCICMGYFITPCV